MLHRARAFLNPGGYFFLVLPLACTTNSRYLTHPTLISLFTTLGFTLIQHRGTESSRAKGKAAGTGASRVAYWLFRMEAETVSNEANLFKKRKIIEDGAGMNNFSIV